MAITIERGFLPGDRYRYDFRVRTTDKGWAQVDTSQDASYFGTWLNPTLRKIFCYCEGDLITTNCDTDAELVDEITKMRDWNVENGHKFLGIDPGFNERLKASLVNVGLAEFLY